MAISNFSELGWKKGLFLVGFSVVAGVGIGRILPSHSNEVVTKQVVEEKVMTVKLAGLPLTAPNGKPYPMLETSAQACSGAPVIITHLSESTAQGDDSGIIYTWLTVQPAGDQYTVACYLGGEYSWKVGDLIALPNGKVTG